MTFTTGTRLGIYEILEPLGAGGMGQVYLARDSKLKRDVAIKVLNDKTTDDDERVSRFKREAEILASLNHPRIAAIYDMVDFQDCRFLVLELVEGETLAERIAKGPLAMDDAMRFARQIADGLEAAHEKGITHRDLKPANIKIRPDGSAKILDFGLAKVQETQHADTSNSPTRMTASLAGAIMGTASYMSPEQARGMPVDRRTDIFAFGAVLYEMLTGRVAFDGQTISDRIAAILSQEPDWNALPVGTPPIVLSLLRRCLQKDPKARLHDIADLRIELDEASSAPATAEPIEGRKTRRLAVWGVLLVVLTAAITTGLIAAFRSTTPPRLYRSSIVLPDGMHFDIAPAGRFALSPNGRHLVYAAANASGQASLWLRSLDGVAPQELAGTDGAAYPFWSPDSRFVAFRAGGKLKKTAISGGLPVILCDAESNSSGSWNRDDVILFTPKGGDSLYRVSALGGAPRPATALDLDSGDAQHWYPFFLPDSRHFLYSVLGSKKGGAIDPRGIYVGSLDSNQPGKLLVESGSNAMFADGHLLFLRGRTLVAQAFDLTSLDLRGDAIPLAEQIQVPGAGDTGTAGAFSVAEGGVLVYQTGTDVVRSQLTWFDRTGRPVGLLGDQADYVDLAISRDGQQALTSVLDQDQGTRDLWVYDLSRALRTRFTFDPANEFGPVWSSDGSRVLFASDRKGGVDVYQKSSSGSAAEDPLFEGNLGEFPESTSPDNRFLLYVSGSGTLRRSDLWILPLFGDRKPYSFAETRFIETHGQFSPDGHWIALATTETGQREIYVAPFPGPGRKSLVSSAGGSWPRWSRNGNEIFYLAPDNTLMVAAVNVRGSGLNVTAGRPLFVTHPRPLVRLDAYPYDVSTDGQRFLVNAFVEDTSRTAITLVVNWTDILSQRDR